MDLAQLHNDIHEGALQLIAEHRVQLFAKAKQLCDNETDADELVVRTIDQAIRKIDTYLGKGDILSWMTSILVNLHSHDIRNPVVRGTEAVDAVALEEYAGGDWSTDREILRNSDCEALREALKHIDPIFRETVLLRYYEDLSLKEIACFLNKPVGTIGRRLHVALRLLAGKMGADFGKLKKKRGLLIFLGLLALTAAAAVISVAKVEKVEEHEKVEEVEEERKGGILSALDQKDDASASAPAEPQPSDDENDERLDLTQDTATQEKKENTMNIGQKAIVGLATVAGLSFASAMADGGAQNVIQMPADYAQLEWIKSTGTQYIDTGVTQTKGLVVSCEILPGTGRKTSDLDRAILGVDWTAWGYLAIICQAQLRFYTLGNACKNGQGSFAALSQYGNGAERVRLECRWNAFSVNGDIFTVGGDWDSSKAALGTVHVFDASNPHSKASRGDITLYQMRMADGGTVLRDFVSARQLSTGKVGLLDMAHLDDLEHAFYANLDSGDDFVAGPRFIFAEAVPPQAYTGLPVVPEIKVFERSNGQLTRLTEGTDYEVTLRNNIVGPAAVRIDGRNDYAGSSAQTTFEIEIPSDGRIRLAGVESRVVVQEGDSVVMPDLQVIDKNGVALDPSCYTANAVRSSADALSLLVVTITSGPYAGAQTAAIFRQAVVPQGYQILDGLTSTGTQYLDTGILPSDDLTVACVLTADPDFVSEHAVFGAGWSTQGFFNMFYNGKHRLNSHGGFVEVSMRSSALAGLPVSIVCKPDEMAIDGLTYEVQGERANVLTSIHVFDCYKSDKRGHFTLHGMQMEAAAGLYLRDFVPVRRTADNKLGFYDTAHPDDGESAFYVDIDGRNPFVAGNPRANFVVGGIPAQDIVPGGCRPAVTIKDRQTGAPLSPENFTCTYSNCDNPGVATVTVEGNAGTPYAGQVASVKFLIRTAVRVDPGKAGDDGDGMTWESPVSLARAMDLLAASGGEIWLKAGRHVLPEALPVWNQTETVVVRGGFAGTETSAGARPAGSITTLDGGGTNALLSVNNGNAMTFERICFTHGAERGFAKVGGAGDILLERCRLLANGVQNAGTINGRGGSFKGTTGTTVTLRNCSVEGNVAPINGNNSGANGYGFGLYFSGLKAAVLENCEFVTNGYDFARNTGVSISDSRGAALYSDGVKVLASGCRFAGNVLYSTAQGGIVFIDKSGAGGSVFDRCQWVGNRDTRANVGGTDDGRKGMLVLSLDAADQTVDVKGCTFAYNLCGAYNGATGLNVCGGTARIRDSIFYGNAVCKDNVTDCDVAVVTASGGARIEASYTLFDHDPSAANVVCDHLVIGDPLFVTTVSEFTNCTYLVKFPRCDTRIPKEMLFKPEKLNEVLAMNVHVRGGSGYLDEKTGAFVGAYAKRKTKVQSPAIDAGDPASPFIRETRPCGGRVNLGCYGNTPYQTQNGQGMIFMLK